MQTAILSLQRQQIYSISHDLSYLKQAIQIAFSQHNYPQVSILSAQLVKLLPQDSDSFLNFAFAELKQHHYQFAYQLYQLALQYQPRHLAEIYDGLTELCYYLKKKEQQIHYARCALEFKKQYVAHAYIQALPTPHAPQFNAAHRQENIISYSLFGAEPRYCENALQNVQRAKILFPEWTCRFYVDNTVPDLIILRLKLLGAQIVLINEQQQPISGLFWRFFVMDDPSVKRFLIRDADSLLSYREQAAVIAWIKSERWFHTLCDAHSHTELILAGLWGGCTGIFKNVQQNIEHFIATHPKAQHRTLDQFYLRLCIYPSLKQSVLLHDSQFYHPISERFPQHTRQFPDELESDFHVGKNDATHFIHIQLDHTQPIQAITWFILNEQGYEVCRYTQSIQMAQQKLSFAIPSAYAAALEQKKWHLFNEIII